MRRLLLRLLIASLAGFIACAGAQELPATNAAPSKKYTPVAVPKTGPPVPISAAIDTSLYALINGVSSTREQCDALADAVWVTAAESSACIRYFAAGIPESGSADKAIVYFPGDVWEGRQPSKSYGEMNVDRLKASAEDWAAKTSMPYVFVARPGTFGSSGDHMQRRRKSESLLMSAALDAIKARLRIKELVVVGYSGGGHVVSALVSMRSDLVCAVPIAAPSSPSLRAKLLNWTTDSTGYNDSYEPTENFNRSLMHQDLRVVVVGDPRDSNAVWPAQVILAETLSSIGVPNAVIPVKGNGVRQHFGQGEVGRMIAAWCAQGLSFTEMASRAAAAQ